MEEAGGRGTLIWPRETLPPVPYINLPAACLVIAVAVLSYYCMMICWCYGRRCGLPIRASLPGPCCWPILGNLPYVFASAATPHLTLARLSRRYGPIFAFRRSCYNHQPELIVISSLALATQVLQGEVFADRPKVRMSELLLYGQHNGVFLAHYSPEWQVLRRHYTMGLFSPRRLQESRHVQHEEVACMVESIRKLATYSGRAMADVHVGKCVAALASNVLGRALISERLVDWESGHGNALSRALHETLQMLSPVLIGEYFPLLGWLDAHTKRQLRQAHHRLDGILSSLLEERCLSQGPSARHGDFLARLLEDTSVRDSIKSSIWELFAAGIDTTRVTVEWAMAELLRNPKHLQEVQAEVDTVLSGKRRQLVQESDLQHLAYLRAVIKEVFRLHPPGPLLLPHASQVASKVNGHEIPSKTSLVVNVWSIGRDAALWENPDEFLPTRFLVPDENTHTIGEPHPARDLNIVFGHGRRRCPGMPLALQLVELTLANLLRSFNWRVHREVDLTEASRNGVLELATPFHAIPTPRLLLTESGEYKVL